MPPESMASQRVGRGESNIRRGVEVGELLLAVRIGVGEAHSEPASLGNYERDSADMTEILVLPYPAHTNTRSGVEQQSGQAPKRVVLVLRL
jgi:hypothetical protein